MMVNQTEGQALVSIRWQPVGIAEARLLSALPDLASVRRYLSSLAPVQPPPGRSTFIKEASGLTIFLIEASCRDGLLYVSAWCKVYLGRISWHWLLERSADCIKDLLKIGNLACTVLHVCGNKGFCNKNLHLRKFSIISDLTGRSPVSLWHPAQCL